MRGRHTAAHHNERHREHVPREHRRRKYHLSLPYTKRGDVSSSCGVEPLRRRIFIFPAFFFWFQKKGFRKVEKVLAVFLYPLENAVRKGMHAENKEGLSDLIIKEAHKRTHTAALNLCRIRTCYKQA
jgi:hypothetical protein